MAEREAGFAEREKRRMVSRPPCSFEGKWTFFGQGEEGAERARVWLVLGSCGEGMLGEEDDDLSDDFRGLPLERKMGEEVVRGSGEGGEGRAGKGMQRLNGLSSLWWSSWWSSSLDDDESWSSLSW